MKAMKLAFTEALEASAHLTLCDYCPIQHIHKLCNKLDGRFSIHLNLFLDPLSLDICPIN